MTAPDVTVEMAFGSTYSTPAASRVWTDVTAYTKESVEAGIDFGRQDVFTTADANGFTLTLNNTDGRFTPGLASGAYYPDVRVGVPVRLTATPSGQPASVRFTGYVDAWPLEWPGGSQDYAVCQISARSRLARLGADRPLRSVVEEEILLDGPAAYYPLGEAEGATSAADVSGASAASLTMAGAGADVTFGTATGPGTDGLTAATFAGGKRLEGAASLSAESAIWLEVYFNTSGSAAHQYMAIAYDTASADQISLSIDATGVIFAASTTTGGGANNVTMASSAGFNDGRTHHAEAVFEAGVGLTLYVDGVIVGTTANTLPGHTLTAKVFHLGAYEDGTLAFTGTMAHAAYGAAALSAARAGAHAEAGLTGFAGEPPADRIERYAGYAALPAVEINADTGISPMAHVDTTGQTAADMLHLVETTEGGVLFDGRDGTLQFRDRDSRYLAPVALTLQAYQVEVGVRPVLDRTGLVNDVTASTTDGTVTATAVDQASVADYGRKTEPLELATTDENEPHAAAWWRVNNYAAPQPRISTLRVALESLTGAEQTTLLNLTVGSRIAVANWPSQVGTIYANGFFVEGCSETIGPGYHWLEFNVSDATAYVGTFVLDSATRGVLDTNVLAY